VGFCVAWGGCDCCLQQCQCFSSLALAGQHDCQVVQALWRRSSNAARIRLLVRFQLIW
jgi:hypothetical protein